MNVRKKALILLCAWGMSVSLFGCSKSDSEPMDSIPIPEEWATDSYESELIGKTTTSVVSEPIESTESSSESSEAVTTTFKSNIDITASSTTDTTVAPEEPSTAALNSDLVFLVEGIKKEDYYKRVSDIMSEGTTAVSDFETRLGRDLTEVHAGEFIAERFNSYPYFKVSLKSGEYEVQSQSEGYLRVVPSDWMYSLVLDSTEGYSFDTGETFICVGCISPGGAPWFLPLVHTSDGEFYESISYSYSLLEVYE